MQTKVEERLSRFTEEIIYVNFNQDCSCLCIGTEDGYLIYNISPFKEIFKRSMNIQKLINFS